MNDGFDVDGVSKQQLTDLVNDSLGSELSEEKKGSNVSNLQSKSDSIPIKQSNPSVSDRTPQTSVPEAGMAIATQDLRSLDQSDPAKVSKAQASKDPISQSLASSEQTATQSGPDRRSIPVLSGEVSAAGSRTGPSPSVKETNSEQPRQGADRDSQPAPVRADSAGSGSLENSGPKLLDKSLENGSPVNKAENLNKPSIPESSQLNSAGLPKISDVERSIKRNSDTENPDSSFGKSGNFTPNSAPPSKSSAGDE